MSGGRTAACKNRLIIEDATRAGWRNWKPPPKDAPCAGRDRHPRRQPVLARGRAPRRARPGAERPPVAARDLVAGGRGFLRKAANEPDSAGRLRLRRDVNPAVIGVSLAETAETPCRLAAVANVSASVLIGVTLAEIAEIPSPARSGDQRFVHQDFAGAPMTEMPDARVTVACGERWLWVRRSPASSSSDFLPSEAGEVSAKRTKGS
jgi:hypothetical protein